MYEPQHAVFSMAGEPWRRSGAIHFCDATLGLWSICRVWGVIHDDLRNFKRSNDQIANSMQITPKLTKNITDSHHILKGFVSARWERSQKSLATWATLECAGVMDSRQAVRSMQKGAKGLLHYAWWIQMIIVLGYDKKLEGAIFLRCRWCTFFIGTQATSRVHGSQNSTVLRGICKGITEVRRAILQGQGTWRWMKSNNQTTWVVHRILLVMILWYVCRMQCTQYTLWYNIITTIWLRYIHNVIILFILQYVGGANEYLNHTLFATFIPFSFGLDGGGCFGQLGRGWVMGDGWWVGGQW